MPEVKKKKAGKGTGGFASEGLPDPNTVKNGSSTTFIAGWSSYPTLASVTAISAQVQTANKTADGGIGELPRTDIFLLPTEDRTAAVSERGEMLVEVVDQMHIDGISLQQCGKAHAEMRSFASPHATPSAPAETQGDEAVDANAEEKAADSEEGGAVSETEATTPSSGSMAECYAAAVKDRRYGESVPVGASFTARDAVVTQHCVVQGVAPTIVVPPQLPAKPDLDAVTLDTPAGEGDRPTSSGEGAAAKGGKAAKKTKKLTPEQLQELEQKKAELEAVYVAASARAVEAARAAAAHLMTFAHPDRWAKVVIRHVTFLGPVVVRQAHVTFLDCRFLASGGDHAQLLVSQYCRVQCNKCSFEEPTRCGLYAYPGAQLETRLCLFTGVSQDVLWEASVPSVSPQAGGKGGKADAPSKTDKNGSAAASPMPVNTALKAALQSAQNQRGTAVGIQADSAKLNVQGCVFVGLGVGVHVHGSYSIDVLQHAAAAKTAQQLTNEVCDAVLEGNSFHHFANTAMLIGTSTRLVALKQNYVEACTYYGLDCQGDVKSVLIRRNHFTADAAVRIRAGANVSLVQNDFQCTPVNDNGRGKAAMQAAY